MKSKVVTSRLHTAYISRISSVRTKSKDAREQTSYYHNQSA